MTADDVQYLMHACLESPPANGTKEPFDRIWNARVRAANAMLPGSRMIEPGQVAVPLEGTRSSSDIGRPISLHSVTYIDDSI